MAKAAMTGLSLISPAGWTVDENVRAAMAGFCAGANAGLSEPMARVPLAQLPCSDRLAAAETRWVDRSAALAVLAAADALADAGLADAWMSRPTSSIVVGTSKAGALTALAACEHLHNHPAGGAGEAVGRLWPWGTPGCAAAALTQRYRPGGEVATVAAACATGLAALARGADMIADGRADTVLVVATDASIHPLFVSAFWNMGALARWDTVPGDACRPFSADREGFILSEGAAAVVLQAPRGCGRNPNSPCVHVAGAATGSQASHLVRPADTSAALASILSLACRDAGWSDPRVDLIHAHGTGTPIGDRAESAAIRLALGPDADAATVISTKPTTGHMLGAAGLANAVLTAGFMKAAAIPAAANYRIADPACDLNYNVDGPSRLQTRRSVCMANGFGGGSVAVALQLD